MKSNVKYIAEYLDSWCSEHGSTRIMNTMNTTYESINRARAGKQVSVGKLDEMIRRTGITIAEASIKKGKIDDKYKCSSAKYIKENLDRLMRIYNLNAHTLSTKMYGKNKRKAPYAGKYPKPKTLQEIADFFNIEVADLFVNPRMNKKVYEDATKDAIKIRMQPDYEVHSKQGNRNKINKDKVLSEFSDDCAITGIENIKPRIYKFSRDFNFLVDENDMEKLFFVNVIEAESIIRRYGFSIGESILKKGVKTEWYKDTSALYLPFNLERIRNEKGIAVAELVRVSDTIKNVSTYLRWESGQSYPNMMQMQQVANALDVEIGDLFVTPDGCE